MASVKSRGVQRQAVIHLCGRTAQGATVVALSLRPRAQAALDSPAPGSARPYFLAAVVVPFVGESGRGEQS